MPDLNDRGCAHVADPEALMSPPSRLLCLPRELTFFPSRLPRLPCLPCVFIVYFASIPPSSSVRLDGGDFAPSSPPSSFLSRFPWCPMHLLYPLIKLARKDELLLMTGQGTGADSSYGNTEHIHTELRAFCRLKGVYATSCTSWAAPSSSKRLKATSHSFGQFVKPTMIHSSAPTR